MRIGRSAVKAPPTFQTIDRKFRSVVGYSHCHVSGVLSDIVNTKRNRHALRIAREVRVDFYRLPAPTFSLSSVISDELLLFVSMLMTGSPSPRNCAFRTAMYLNCWSRSGC